MKKLIIIGRGTAGAQAAMHMNAWTKDQFEIEWVFDDSIPPQSVGEGATVQLPANLMSTEGFTYSQLDQLGGSLKTGIYKSGWGASGKEFYHDFFPPTLSIHFQAHLLHKYALERLDGQIKIDNRFVGNSADLDADFIFDCSGTPKEFGLAFKPTNNIPVNTAKVWQCPWDKPEFTHTLAIARPYGWVFGIPLTNRCSIGYIYNKDFATPEQIEEDVQEVFDKYGVTPGPDGNYIEFKSYWRRRNFSGRTGYNGNASFFLEPLEATSTATMDLCQRKMFDWMYGNLSADQANADYYEFMRQTELMIMLHYWAGSAWKNEFWDYAESKADEVFNVLHKNDQRLKDKFNYAIAQQKSASLIDDQSSPYSTWAGSSFAVHLRELGIQDKVNSYLGVDYAQVL